MGTLKSKPLKKSTTIFLQVVIVLISIGALALLLWEPQIEGRNANASFFEIYFKDPFLAYIYLASLAFFIALYQAFRLLRNIRHNEIFSQRSVNALRKIKYCAVTIIAFIVGAEAYFFIIQRGKEDIAGGVMIGLIIIFVSVIIVAVTAVFERIVQKAVDIKSENDLIV